MTALTHFRTPLLQTPFHPRTSAANTLNRWGPWGGYMTALCFGDVDMEYTAIRNGASVYDLCPMVKYRITGRDAAAYLNRLTLRDAAKLPVGAVHYTGWTDDAGKLLDDGTLFRPRARGLSDLLPGVAPAVVPRLRRGVRGAGGRGHRRDRGPVPARPLLGDGAGGRGLRCLGAQTLPHGALPLFGPERSPFPAPDSPAIWATNSG